MRLLFLPFFLPALAWAHGLHAVKDSPPLGSGANSPVQVKDLGEVVAVRRQFPLTYENCAASYDDHMKTCLVSFSNDRAAHQCEFPTHCKAGDFTRQMRGHIA